MPVAALVAAAAAIAGSAVLGAGAGFLWAALAPRAVLVAFGNGSVGLVNPETSAFIAADGWFSLLSLLGGVVSGLLGYLLAVRRYRELAMAGVLVGGLAAGLVAMWIGQQSGQAAFNHRLAVSQPGALLRAPLILGGHGTLALWPLAAGLTAGGIEAVILLRERWREAEQQQTAPGLPPLGAAIPPAVGSPALDHQPPGQRPQAPRPNCGNRRPGPAPATSHPAAGDPATSRGPGHRAPRGRLGGGSRSGRRTPGPVSQRR